jgi:DNA-directed RNA polymerase subunit beta'
MGRLIPAGTGMKYYRNVKIADDATVNRKEEDEFDEMDIRGGIDLPVFAVPGVEPEDTDEGYDEAEETLDEISLENEEVFDDSADLVIDEVDDDF